MSDAVMKGSLGKITVPRIPRKWWVRLGATFVGMGGTALIASFFASTEDWWLHSVWTVTGLAITIPLLLRCLRYGFVVVVTDHLVMFTAAFSLYFLFGASFIVFGPDAEVARSLNYYPVDAVSALKANAVNGIGFGIALLLASFVPSGWFSRTSDYLSARAARVPAPVVLVMLVLFGFGAFAYTIMFDLGFRRGVVPGSIRAASQFSVVAVFLAASYRGRGARKAHALAFLLAAALALAGLIMFNKTQVLVALGALVAGLSLVYPSRRVLVSGLVVIVSVYLAIGSVVAYGRNSLGSRTVALEERWQLVQSGFLAGKAEDPLATTSGWGRLCYLPAQSAGMDFYDQGMGANDFSLIPWVFVPRIVAPGKPVITRAPEEFHEKITGNSGSSTGQGIFSSGYYSGGWAGVLVAAVLAGGILAQTSAVARSVTARGAVLLLPLSLYGVYIAFRVDGAFLADYIGAFVFMLYPLLIFWMLRFPVAGRRREAA